MYDIFLGFLLDLEGFFYEVIISNAYTLIRTRIQEKGYYNVIKPDNHIISYITSHV